MTSAQVSAARTAAEDLQRIARTWHALSPQEALDAIGSRTSGLTEAEVEDRRTRFGENALPEEKPRTLLSRFLAQLDSMLIYVLLGSAVITALLGHAVDTAVILGVVVINAIFGVVQEGKAERALDAIRAMISPTAQVMRNGKRIGVAARDLVPGDILLIEAGDRVTADARLISARGLRIDESALTGESVPVDKRPQADVPDSMLADRTSMAYSGTLVTQGQATSVVIATGAHTEIGRITTMLSTIHVTTTPLIRQMNAFAQQLSIAILALSAATCAFAITVRGYAVADAFLAAVGMAVAAIPEGLPAVMTITLALGVERMSRRNAIVRQLPAVETLGSVSVICTDKTGTLTRNEMTARNVVTASRVYEIGGIGYTPEGDIREADTVLSSAPRTLQQDLAALVRIASACNDAELVAPGNPETQEHERQSSGWHVAGDPMEGALVVLAHKAGVDIAALRAAMPRRDTIPFDAAHRFMATLHASNDKAGPLFHSAEDPDGTEAAMVLYLKGAPEDVLALCTREAAGENARPIDPVRWQQAIDALADKGQRTLAFAMKPMPAGTCEIGFEDVRDGLVLVGLVGLIDPPRAEAKEAIAQARAAGISTKMITGDHALTARAIARDLGLNQDGECAVATGREIDSLSPSELAELAQNTCVFARTAPEHKLKLIEALRTGGAVIAMTGDGVNDAPALKRADVGIAMGRKGTEAAKEASQMVLADDNFASIVAAVKEGRTVYDNLTKVIAWTLPTSFGETLVVMLAILGGFLLPVTPVQILWVNMVTAVALGLVLAFEPAEDDVMMRPPRRPNQSLLTPLLVWQVVLVSILFVAGSFTMFWWARRRGLDIAEARTIVVNTIVVFEIFYLFAVRYLRSGSITWRGMHGTPAVLIGVGTIIVLQLAFTYLPMMQALFDTRAVSFADGVSIIALGVVLLAVLEIEKRLRRVILARERPPTLDGSAPRPQSSRHAKEDRA
ncbi:MAG: HAD-IC family P-type ATPase [Hyphomicrobiaceae bacterium]|nr:HAD-IC family P-type ATPase [Hyphomicrobiaceae bacterium]